MPRTCASCSSEHRSEIDRKLRSGATREDVARWLKEIDAPITAHAIGRHAKDHLGVAPPRGRRPVSDDFLQAVIERVGERMAEGEIEPGIRDGISAQKEKNRLAEKTADRDLLLKVALALTGNVRVIEARVLDPDVAAIEAEFVPLLTAGE